MASALLDYVQNVWPFSVLKINDLNWSDRLVKRLSIPEHTKQFVFAISDAENNATIYILCAQNLSERSARDAEHLIREVRPDAIVSLMGDSVSDVHEYELVESISDLIPTSAFRVLMRCFMDKTNKDKYEDLAGNLLLKEIFGVGFYEHFFVGRRMAEEIGSSFLVLESHSLKRNGATISSTSRRFLVANDLQLQMVKLVSPSVDLSLSMKALPKDTGLETVKLSPNYCPPPFAQMVYPLLIDLHDIFSDIPSMDRALYYAQKLFHNVHRGESVDPEVLSEVCTFQIAVEGVRVALTNAGRLPIHKLGNLNTDFENLAIEEKYRCLHAQALRSQAKKFKTVVAITDASGLAGLRKYWNTHLPEEIRDVFEEIVVCQDFSSGETTKDGKKRLLSDKPVVAIGAGATAVLGVSSLSKVAPMSTVIKVVTLNLSTSLKLFLTQTHKATAFALSKILGSSTVKAAASANKIRVVTHSVIASVEKTSFSAMRTAFYEIMRKRRIRPIGVVPWATFGLSMATCGGLVAYADGIECAVESFTSAPSIASLGRGIQNLQETSENVRQSSRRKIQNAIESLVYRFKKVKIQ